MIDWIKNRKLNNSSAFFVGIALIVSILSSVIYIFLIQICSSPINNIAEITLTILIPTFINLLIIPAFKIISLYQNIDEKIIKDEVTDEKIKYYNEKQIVYTEALLTCTTALPIFFWYVNKGSNYLIRNYLGIGTTIFVTIAVLIIGILTIKKLRR
ncbi:hypothetical protein [Staphylococcus equorum]|uniref:hypothetical protein n=1 Tax=Staphylococcus equorum TaxID=246432 RepID=UPI0021BEDC38|nr:hypothetical protein [Staphylococcus equorum]